MVLYNLNLDVKDISNIQEYTSLRFKEPLRYRLANTFSMYEQGYLSDEELRAYSEEVTGLKFDLVFKSVLRDKIVNAFENTNLVPFYVIESEHKIICGATPDISYTKPFIVNYEVEIKNITLYDYLTQYQELYGRHDILVKLPIKTVFDMVIKEAIDKKASDITISTLGNASKVYYCVHKDTIKSNRVIDAEDMEDLIRLISIKSPYDFMSMKPKYVDIELNDDYRGRVVINKKFKGYVITIRLLPNELFDFTLEKLNVSSDILPFLSNKVCDRRVGLRLIVGATNSGKNTTALSLLRKIVDSRSMKVVSVENPVEQVVPGIEQINTETEEEYALSVQSLVRQNPDFVYVTEINDTTAKPIIKVCNTGKCVLSTLHANGVAETITRLMDLTGLEQDRIIQQLHSVMYQELYWEEDHFKPYIKYLEFDDEIKQELYGLSLGEMVKIIKSKESGDEWVVR